MLPPSGYSKASPGQVCKLHCSLYWLKQASQQWNNEFSSKLHLFGLTQSAHDNYLFFKKSAHSFLTLFVYVDDVLITDTDTDDIL